MWWLDYYTGFREHVEARYEVAALDTDVAAIFDLRAVKEGAPELVAVPEDGPEIERVEVAVSEQVERTERIERIDVAAVHLAKQPQVSVVIPTFNRAEFLRPSLQSLVNDSLGIDNFEVVVVDDGSTDDTEAVCREFASRMSLRYVAQDHGGISVAKNNGAEHSSAPVIVWFDDDDVAAGDLLARHAALHAAHPEPGMAVLGYTTWAPWLEVTEVMRFATGAGGYLFCYDRIEDGQMLDFGYFWGGRSSCKREFLMEHGLFRPEFNFGSEDMELGFRLSKVGLKVLYDRRIVQYMQRPLTFDDLCRRCERQGRSLWMFSEMHDDPAIRDYCDMHGAFERWETVKDELPLRVEAAHRLEQEILAAPPADRESIRQELYSHYWFAFDNFKLKGVIDTAQQGS
jgi:glycosyltransferase involved in cell wall biosynthesis